MMPRRFFFGLVEVPFWGFRSGLTIAQIELLSVDQPMVVYKADKNKKKPWENGTVSQEYADKAYRKWLENKKKREREGLKSDINKIMTQGKKVNLNTLTNDD